MNERGCMIFRCVRRREYACCADCWEREKCWNPCLNSPEKCGDAQEKPSKCKPVKKAAQGAGGKAR